VSRDPFDAESPTDFVLPDFNCCFGGVIGVAAHDFPDTPKYHNRCFWGGLPLSWVSNGFRPFLFLRSWHRPPRTSSSRLRFTCRTTPREMDERKRILIDYCISPRSLKELLTHVQLKNRFYFVEYFIKPLLGDGYLEMTLPDKPTSPKQKYRTTAKGKALLNTWDDTA